MPLKLRKPGPFNKYCSDCMKSTEHIRKPYVRVCRECGKFLELYNKETKDA